MNLFQQAEQGFDKLFNYSRQQVESFHYQNTIKNGSISEQLQLQKREFQSSERILEINQEKKLSTNLETKKTENQDSIPFKYKKNNQSPTLPFSLTASETIINTTPIKELPIKPKRRLHSKI